MVKRFFLAVILTVVSVISIAQEVKEVTLVVNGDGATKEEATHAALRSAIEQAFGTFVSANTTILNDELVKDEIATVSSGNIQSFTELSSYTLPNGNTSVSLQATVSIGNLVSYARSKGSECEFAGATFGANLKMAKLKYQNAVIVEKNLIDYIMQVGPDAFDYRLDIGEPILGNNTAKIMGTISIDTNKFTRSFCITIVKTLMSIRFSQSETKLLATYEKGKKFDYFNGGGIPIIFSWLCDVFEQYCTKPIVRSNLGLVGDVKYFYGGEHLSCANNVQSHLISLVIDYYRSSLNEREKVEFDERGYGSWPFILNNYKGLYYPRYTDGTPYCYVRKSDIICQCSEQLRGVKDTVYCLNKYKKDSKRSGKPVVTVNSFYEIPIPKYTIVLYIPTQELINISNFKVEARRKVE